MEEDEETSADQADGQKWPKTRLAGGLRWEHRGDQNIPHGSAS
jgi:hypothetical protein